MRLGVGRRERRADAIAGADERVGIAQEPGLEPRQAVAHRIEAEIGLAEHDRGRGPVVTLAAADQQQRAIGRKQQFGERAREADQAFMTVP